METAIERAEDVDCEGGIRSVSAKKIKADEARKMATVMIDTLTKNGEVEAESGQRSYIAWQ